MASEIPLVSKPSRRVRWQFSLREILLLILAVSAILALVIQSRPFRTTSFFQSFDDRKILQAACQRLGRPCNIGHGSGFSLRRSNAIRSSDAFFRDPPVSEAGQVLAEFRKELESILTQQGCTIHGRGHSGDLAKNNIREFSFDYEQGNTQGNIYVESHPSTEDAWSLKVMIQEFKN